jgi:N-acyl-D-amino-acid deacylase
VILDFEKIKDVATYEEPELTGEGIKYVILNGNVIVKDKSVVSKTNGKFL